MASLCSPNAVAAYDYFIGRGLESHQAAAIVGNLQRESGAGLDTRAFFQKEASYGIAQWRNERYQGLLAFAAGGDRDPWSLDTQLAFLWHELVTTPAFGLAALRASSSLEEATRIFQDQFERCDPARCALQERINNARAILECSTLAVPSRSKIGWLAAAVGIAAVAAGAVWVARRPAPEPIYPRYRPDYIDRPRRFRPDRMPYL